MDVGWVLVTNLFVVAGVLFWGWPAGNVFVLFWIENVILGAVTVVMIATAEAGDPALTSSAARWGRSAFFVLHYGLFALVHGVFAAIIAFNIGFSLTLWALGLPALLIALRYTVDLATRWFLGQQRRHVTPEQAFASPYGRLFVLHVATILGFVAVMPSFRRRGNGGLGGTLAALVEWLSLHGLVITNGALVVSLLLMLKIIADLAGLRRRTPTVRPLVDFGAR